jgi:hypothetical protein
MKKYGDVEIAIQFFISADRDELSDLGLAALSLRKEPHVFIA